MNPVVQLQYKCRCMFSRKRWGMQGHATNCQLLSASLLCAQLLVRVVLDVLLCFTDNLRCLHTAFIVLSAWTAGRTHPISHPFNAVSLKTAPTPGSTDVMTTCFQDYLKICGG